MASPEEPAPPIIAREPDGTWRLRFRWAADTCDRIERCCEVAGYVSPVDFVADAVEEKLRSLEAPDASAVVSETPDASN